jgi:hypothetical protein
MLDESFNLKQEEIDKALEDPNTKVPERMIVDKGCK